MVEWLGELRKEIKESAAEQLCMDNISMGLNESNDLLISDSSVSVSIPVIASKFPNFTEPFFSLTLIFLPTFYDSY